jgi:hypothetical protein
MLLDYFEKENNKSLDGLKQPGLIILANLLQSAITPYMDYVKTLYQQLVTDEMVAVATLRILLTTH